MHVNHWTVQASSVTASNCKHDLLEESLIEHVMPNVQCKLCNTFIQPFFHVSRFNFTILVSLLHAHAMCIFFMLHLMSCARWMLRWCLVAQPALQRLPYCWLLMLASAGCPCLLQSHWLVDYGYRACPLSKMKQLLPGLPLLKTPSLEADAGL